LEIKNWKLEIERISIRLKYYKDIKIIYNKKELNSIVYVNA